MNFKCSVSPEKEEESSNYELLPQQLQSIHVTLDIIYVILQQNVIAEKDKNDLLSKLYAICGYIEKSAKSGVICKKNGDDVKCESDKKEHGVENKRKKECATNESKVKLKEEFVKPSEAEKVKT